MTESAFTHSRRGPIEGVHLIGYDLDRGRRPGDPMHGTPRNGDGARAAGTERAPVEQAGIEGREHRAALTQSTPVFGTAQPPARLSGAMRRAAYRIPEHHARHWALLMAADRVDVLEDRLGAGGAAGAVALAAGVVVGVVAARWWRG